MKTTIKTIVLVFAPLAITAFAQEATNINHFTAEAIKAAAAKPYVRPWVGIERKAHECFTDAEDIEYHEVYNAAMKDPELKAAREAAEDARIAAMKKVDPSLASVLDTFRANERTMNLRDAIARMTPEEHAKYDHANAAAYKDYPEPGALMKVYRDLIPATMIKLDPAIAELDKRLTESYAAARKEFYGPKTQSAESKEKKP